MVFGGQFTWGSASLLQLLSVNTVPATLALNMGGSIQRNFYTSAPIAAPKTWQLQNNNNALQFNFMFELTGAFAQTMPADFISNDALFAGGVWTPFIGGKYMASGVKNNSEWFVQFFGPFA